MAADIMLLALFALANIVFISIADDVLSDQTVLGDSRHYSTVNLRRYPHCH